MQLAFCLYKYFPFGGLQRDFLRIALACQSRGHDIRVYTLEWRGELPAGFDLVRVPVRAWWNHCRYRKFSAWVAADLARRPADRIIGFNKMPGLDIYYAADPCYEEMARSLRNPFYRLGGRYRHFAAWERAVFAPESRTGILMISGMQQPFFMRHYGTQAEHFHPLPPGVSPDRRAPPDAPAIRAAFRTEFGLGGDDLLLVQIGSGFKTKGLDRSIAALAALPEALRARARLIALGDDDPRPFLRQAKTLGLSERVAILRGRNDVPRFLLGADLLVHPAYSENTGTVLLEALVAGLPVLATDVCGYAHYIAEAGAGRLVATPFVQKAFDAALAGLLADPDARARCSRQALVFAEQADLYSLHERAADFILNDKRKPPENAAGNRADFTMFQSTPIAGRHSAEGGTTLPRMIAPLKGKVSNRNPFSMSETVLYPPFDRLWAGHDPFAMVEALQGEVFRELAGRRTLRTEIDGRGYFVKIHRGAGWGEIFKNLVSLRLPVLGACNEWRAARRLAELGVDALRAVAFGERGANPARRHSFIVTEELAPAISLEDYCRDWARMPPAPALKRALIARVAEMARRMHEGRVNHRDFYLCHFLLHTDPPPTPTALRLSLIDLHRAQIHTRALPERWRRKDLAGLYFSALEIGLTRRDLLRFLRIYFDAPLRRVLRDKTALFKWIAHEAARLAERYRRKTFSAAKRNAAP
ncbi:MAG: lipopolysaccharide core heptose(I) kinase RfaP [Azoarcus sp.]|jgi:UDP-glucose:(heptosyl)LPS alpha-1,3-glucosyltransferase|nr:lipopolysaccharide core heptose(I) kinase RfaP [Azoarcus sp.]